MNTVWLVAKKEIAHGLNSQMAYVLALIFVIAMPVPIYWTNTPSNVFLNGNADLRFFFTMLPLYLMVFIPAMAMRAWAEERHKGTMEMLLTLPLRTRDLVLGKFLGYYLMIAVSLLGTFMVPVLLADLGNIDWGPIIGGYLGGLLLAASCLAIAMFAGALTRHQVTAFICGFLLLAVLMLINVPEFNLHGRFANVAGGVIDTRDLGFYLICTAVFLYLNIKLVEVSRG
jgi:ABC-2 type transport system permease protein